MKRSTVIHMRLLVVGLVTLLAIGCDDDDPSSVPDSSVDGSFDGGSDAPQDGPTSDAPADGGAALLALDELKPGRWHELLPGGDTICSRGTEYAFYVFPGTSNNVAVDFIGGGAC